MRKKVIYAILLAGMIFAPATLPAQNLRGQGAGNHRGTTATTRPGNNNTNQNKPNTTNRPGGNQNPTRPGGNQNTTRPGSNQNTTRPGGNHNPTRPGGNQNTTRPGGNQNTTRPGGNHNPTRPGGHHGHLNIWQSAPRPGVGATPSPGRYSGIRPPRLNRWERPLPPPPSRVQYVAPIGAPTISGILGLTFGTLINYGVNSLLNAGYNVAGTWDNSIYLNNVTQFGLIWPQATVYYGNNGMNGARFQITSFAANTASFNAAYNAICAAYGMPVSSTNYNGTMTRVWWGGNNTGYITLQFGPGYNEIGQSVFYTDLIYGM